MHRQGAQFLLDSRSSIYVCRQCTTPLTSIKRHQSAIPRQPRPPPKGKEWSRMHQFSGAIVNAAARGPNQLWEHPKSRRGEENRLTAAIRTKQSASRAPSVEKANFEAGLGFDDSGDIGGDVPSASSLDPGMFVELRRSEIQIQGVVLFEKYYNHSWYSTTLTSSGEIWRHRRDDALFTIPAFVPRDLISRCGMDEIASTESENMARVEVLKRIRDFEKLIERYNVPGHLGQDAYNLLKSPDPNKWSRATVADVAKLTTQKKGHPVLSMFMVHKHLMNLSKYFVADPVSYRATQMFFLRPQSHVDAIEAVLALSRSRDDNHLDAFAHKARRIIEANRRRSLETWHDAPSLGDGDNPGFDSNDSLMIDFLLHSLRALRSIQNNPYTVIISTIIKKIGLYPDVVDGGVTHQVLIDLGVLAPWQDISELIVEDFDESPSTERLAQHRAEVVSGVGMREPISQRIIIEGGRSAQTALLRASRGILGPDALYASDPAESIRHDFGDMPVYIIDDAGAEEIDDGISIERISGDPHSVWIHTHIADPTAIIPPTHTVAGEARNQLETMYMIHKSIPMLPGWLLQRASLGASSAAGQPERVLTFSAKVDSAGDIVDYKVRAGLIRNVRSLSYDDVDLAMGRWEPSASYPFGGAPPAPTTPAHLDSFQLQDLWALDETVHRLVENRLKLPIFATKMSRAELSLSPKPVPSSRVTSSQLKSFSGFPNVRYSVPEPGYTERGSRRMVQEAMKAACRVASRFCRDRGLPAIRRTSSPPTFSSESELADMLSARDAVGMVDYIHFLATGARPPDTMHALEPAMHWAMGVPNGEGYVRVTSPLRRYSDMMWHWQIKHALINPTSSPLFSTEYLKDFLLEMSAKGSSRKRLERLHTQFWVLLFLRRWMNDPRGHDSQTDPLSKLVGRVFALPVLNVQKNDYQCKLHLPALGLQGTLGDIRRRSGGIEYFIGDECTAKVAEIRLGSIPFLMLVPC